MQWLMKRLIRNKIISGTAVLKGISLSGTDLTSPKKMRGCFRWSGTGNQSACK